MKEMRCNNGNLCEDILFTFMLLSIKGELQCQNKLISSESPSKILQNETKIIEIGQAVLRIFNFKDQDLDTITRKKTTEKPKMLFF